MCRERAWASTEGDGRACPGVWAWSLSGPPIPFCLHAISWLLLASPSVKPRVRGEKADNPQGRELSSSREAALAGEVPGS